MSTEHHYHGTLVLRCVHDRRNNPAEISSDQNVGEARDKARERTIVAGRSRELFRSNLIRAQLDRDRANGREISFLNGRIQAGFYWPILFAGAVASAYDVR